MLQHTLVESLATVGITSLILGASRLEQVEQAVAALTAAQEASRSHEIAWATCLYTKTLLPSPTIHQPQPLSAVEARRRRTEGASAERP